MRDNNIICINLVNIKGYSFCAESTSQKAMSLQKLDSSQTLYHFPHSLNTASISTLNNAKVKSFNL